jgi:hypothetical protein
MSPVNRSPAGFLSLLLAVMATAGGLLAACGTTHRSDATSTAAVSRGFKGDDDDDDFHLSRYESAPYDEDADKDAGDDRREHAGGGYRDEDDAAALSFGHRANRREITALTALSTRYYAAAAAGDGAAACAMQRRVLAAAAVEDYSRGGPPYMRGAKTCAETMTRLFAHEHASLSHGVTVTGVRLTARRAHVFVGSPTILAGYLQFDLERGSWWVAGPTAMPMP